MNAVVVFYLVSVVLLFLTVAALSFAVSGICQKAARRQIGRKLDLYRRQQAAASRSSNRWVRDENRSQSNRMV